MPVFAGKRADRARKLVKLSGSPNGPEAERAAVAACRLIREEGLEVIGADDPLMAELLARRQDVIAMRAEIAQLESEVAALEGDNTQLRSLLQEAARERQQKTAKPTPAKKTKPRAFESKWASRCRTCGELIEVGERIWWRKDGGVWHEDCEDPMD